MKFTNAYCKSYNESLVKINECRIRAVNRYKNTFNYNASVLHPIYAVKGHGYLFKRANGYKPFLYDIPNIDACQYLKKPNNPIVMLVVKQFRNFTNLLDQKCPVTVSFQMFFIKIVHIKMGFYCRGLKRWRVFISTPRL